MIFQTASKLAIWETYVISLGSQTKCHISPDEDLWAASIVESKVCINKMSSGNELPLVLNNDTINTAKSLLRTIAVMSGKKYQLVIIIRDDKMGAYALIGSHGG